MPDGRISGRPCWAADKEEWLTPWYFGNSGCEVSAYPEAGVFCVGNSTDEPQRTVVHLDGGRTTEVELAPYELVWHKA